MMRPPANDRRAAPHFALLALVVGAVAVGTLLVSEPGEAVVAAVPVLFGHAGLLLLLLALVLVIRFLSYTGNTPLSDILSYAQGSPDSFHRVGGSPLGVAFLLLLIFVLLYFRVSLFRGGDDDDS